MTIRSSAGLVSILASLLTVVVGLGLALALIAATGNSPVAATNALVQGAFGNWTAVAGTVAEMLPLIMLALAWIVASSGGLFNVGLDGQLISGGVLSAIVALKISAPTGIHLALGVLAGAIGGAVWVGIAVVLWLRRGVNEVIATLLLNFIAVQILAWSVRGPLMAPNQPYPQSAIFPASAVWPALNADANLNWDLLMVMAVVIVVAIALWNTTWAMRLRVTASNERAARAAGVRTRKVRAWAMIASGALAGIVGSSLVLGSSTHQLSDGFDATYAFDGIAVALLARNSPLLCLPAALLFGALEQGGSAMEAQIGVSSTIVTMTEGVIIVLVAMITPYAKTLRTRRIDPRAAPAASTAGEPAVLSFASGEPE